MINQEIIKTIKVTQVASYIGRHYSQKQTLIGLGLGRLNKSVELQSNASILGMVNKVKHLVKLEEIN